MPPLQFITTTEPGQSKGPRTRKLIRSHVARQYHVARQQAWRDEDEAQANLGEVGLIVAITIEDKHGEKAGQPKPTSDVMRLGHRSPKQSRKNMSIMIDPGGTDPFSRWPLEITPRINILIDHFLAVVGPGMNSFIAGTAGLTDPMKTIYVPFSMSDACVFHGLLLLSARSFTKSSYDISYNVTALKHKVQCIQLVNEALEIDGKQTSDAIIAAVLMLAVEEMLLGNSEVFQAHLRGLRLMIAIRGGLDNLGLGGILKQLALSCDNACQIITGSDPVFAHHEAHEIIPPGFRGVLQTLGVDPRVTKFIKDANSITMIKSFPGYEHATGVEIVSLNTLYNDIRQHINRSSSQSMIVDSTSPDSSFSLIEDCMCHGLWVYCASVLQATPPDSALCLDVGNRLRSALMRSQFGPNWQGFLNLLLWISFVGAQTSTHGPLREWYVLLLKGLNTQLGSSSWSSIKLILKEFLWLESCEISGRTLWLEVENVVVRETAPALTLVLPGQI